MSSDLSYIIAGIWFLCLVGGGEIINIITQVRFYFAVHREDKEVSKLKFVLEKWNVIFTTKCWWTRIVETYVTS